MLTRREFTGGLVAATASPLATLPKLTQTAEEKPLQPSSKLVVKLKQVQPGPKFSEQLLQVLDETEPPAGMQPEFRKTGGSLWFVAKKNDPWSSRESRTFVSPAGLVLRVFWFGDVPRRDRAICAFHFDGNEVFRLLHVWYMQDFNARPEHYYAQAQLLADRVLAGTVVGKEADWLDEPYRDGWLVQVRNDEKLRPQLWQQAVLDTAVDWFTSVHEKQQELPCLQGENSQAELPKPA